MSFFKNPEPDFAALPDELRSAVIASLTKLDERLAELNIAQSPEVSASVAKVWFSSLFVAESCMRKPELLVELVNSGDLRVIYSDNR